MTELVQGLAAVLLFSCPLLPGLVVICPHVWFLQEAIVKENSDIKNFL